MAACSTTFSLAVPLPRPLQDDAVAFEVNLAVKGDVTIGIWFTDHFAEVRGCPWVGKAGLDGALMQRMTWLLAQ
jgi:hypothetical protein